MSWSALTTDSDKGGSSILSYNLQWNAGSGSTYYNLVGYTSDYAATSFTITSSITAGTTYLFKLRAKNSYGWGVFSTIVSIDATDKPSQMSAVTTTIESNTFVRISWSAPSDNYDTITKYRINIL